MTDSFYSPRTLQAASYDGQLDAVRQYIVQGVDINAVDNELAGRTALQAAMQQCHVEIVRFLLDHGANANELTRDGKSLLHWAVATGNAEIVRMLLEAGAEVNAGDWENQTPLMRASHSGNLEMVTLLLDYGADINAHTANVHPEYYGGATALIEAIKEEHLDVVRLLLDRGADVNAQGAAGTSALDWATMRRPDRPANGMRKDSEISPLVQLLLDRGAKGGERRMTGGIPLDTFCVDPDATDNE
jgi:ankyrin repeat protein